MFKTQATETIAFKDWPFRESNFNPISSLPEFLIWPVLEINVMLFLLSKWAKNKRSAKGLWRLSKSVISAMPLGTFDKGIETVSISFVIFKL